MAFRPLESTDITVNAPTTSPVAPVAEQKKSIKDTLLGAGKAVGDFFTGSEQGLGKNVADIATAPQAQAQASGQSHQDAEYLQTLIGLRRKAQAEGNQANVAHYTSLIENHQPTQYQAPTLPSTGEVGLNLAGTAADILTAGTYGAAKTGAMKTGELALKAAPTAVTLAGKGIGAGAQVAKNVGTSMAENAAKKQFSKVVDTLALPIENMTMAQKKEAIDSGRHVIEAVRGGVKVSVAPTNEIVRATEILTNPKLWKSPVVAKDAPNVVYAKVKSAISTLGSKAEKYLEANPVKITNNEDFNLFKGLRDAAEKSSTPSEMKAYDEQMNLFGKQLVGRPGGYTTANYYKALKEWEQNIASKLPRGKEALLDPTGVASAKIQAAADIRKAVRDLIGSKHPDFQPKMYDLASLYEAKDSALINAAKTKTESFFAKHPKTSKAVGAGLTAAGGATAYGAFKSLTD